MNYEPVLLKLSNLAAEEIAWLWRPYLPLGKVTILDGLPGTGKTYFALALAAALSNGSPIFNEPTGEPAKVIYLTREDGLEDTIKPRLDKMGANGEHILVLKGSANFGSMDGGSRQPLSAGGKDYRLFDLSQLEVLEAALEQTKPRLVIIDNIASYLGPKIGMNQAQGIAVLMNAISDLAQKYQAAFLLIRHPAKKLRDFVIYSGAGSYAFAGVVRSMLLIGKDPEDPDTSVMVHSKYNLSGQGPSVSFGITEDGSFEWRGYSAVTASQLFAPDAVKEKFSQSLKQLAKKWLLGMLQDGPLAATQVFDEAKKAGISERTLKRAKEELGIKSVKSVEEWFWVLSSTGGGSGDLPIN